MRSHFQFFLGVSSFSPGFSSLVEEEKLLIVVDFFVIMRRLSFEIGEKGCCLSRVSSDTLPRHRLSFHRNSSSISSVISYVSSRKSFSYDKLAQVPIHLTVVKLDGTSFEINVTKTATVAELKQAVENVFSHLPTKGPDKISWTYVWGHFCLSYGSTKLLNDGDNIKDYGINDGDKLNFVQHLSITYNFIKKQSRKRIDIPKPSTIPEDEVQQVEEDHDDLENLKYQQLKLEVANNSIHNESMICRLFSGWFLYSKLPSAEEKLRFRHNGNPTRRAGGVVGSFRSLFHFCDSKPRNYSSRVSQVEI